MKRNAVERTLEILRVLKGHSLNGLSNREIADALSETPVNISRATAELVRTGFAVQLENGRYAPSIELAQIALAHLNELEHAEKRIQEIKQRTFAGALR